MSQSERKSKTVEQMLTAGVKAFSKFGPEGVTTRYLAKISEVNIAAIHYYFGSKEGYYLEVVRYLVEKIGKLFHNTFEEIEEKLAQNNLKKEDAIRLLHDTVQKVSEKIMLTPEAQFFSSISTREHLNPTPAYEIIYKFVSRVQSVISCIVAHILDMPVNSLEVRIKSYAIIGQILIFRVGKTTICKQLNWKELKPEEARKISNIIAEMACKSIGGDNEKA